MSKHPSSNADFLGIVSSTLCFIHCLIIPFLLLGWSTQWVRSHWLDFFFLGIGLYAVVQTSRSTPLQVVRIGLFVSYFFLFLSWVFHTVIPGSLYLNFVGAIGLIVFHSYNLKYAGRCRVYSRT